MKCGSRINARACGTICRLQYFLCSMPHAAAMRMSAESSRKSGRYAPFILARFCLLHREFAHEEIALRSRHVPSGMENTLLYKVDTLSFLVYAIAPTADLASNSAHPLEVFRVFDHDVDLEERAATFPYTRCQEDQRRHGGERGEVLIRRTYGHNTRDASSAPRPRKPQWSSPTTPAYLPWESAVSTSCPLYLRQLLTAF
jgi:hypothetical protein